MKGDRVDRIFMRRLVLGTVPIFGLLVVWHMLTHHVPGTLFPTPLEVWRVLLGLRERPVGVDLPPLWACAVVSSIRLVLGWGGALACGIPMGLLLGGARWAREAMSPVLAGLRVVSPLAWLPVVILFVGVGSVAEWVVGPAEAWRYGLADQVKPAMILIIGWAAFFPIFLTTEQAARSVRKRWVDAVRMMGAGRMAVVRHVVVPACMPEMWSGARIGFGRAWMIIVAAEMYPGTRSGLGYMIWTSHYEVRYDYTFAAILLIAAIGLVGDLVLQAMQGRSGHWRVGT